MSLRRGFYIHPGERVLIAEDVITTGGSVNATLRLIEQLGGVRQAYAQLPIFPAEKPN
jgi:orotate phosphoribosyltransferase